MGTEAIVNKDKRRFLIGATSVVGGVGAVAAAVPFVMSLWPSERAKAAGAPIEVDISKIEPGQKINVEWRGKVCWLVNRTTGNAGNRCPSSTTGSPTRSPTSRSSPPYCKNETRSIKPIAMDCRRHLHAPRLLADVPPGARAGGSRAGLARRLLLPVPPVEVRSRGPRVQGRAGADEPGRSAAQVSVRYARSSSAKTRSARDLRVFTEQDANEQAADLDRRALSADRAVEQPVGQVRRAEEFQLLVLLRLARRIRAGAADRHRHLPHDELQARRDEGVRVRRVHHARRAVGMADPLHALDRRVDVLHRRVPAHVPRAHVRQLPQAARAHVDLRLPDLSRADGRGVLRLSASVGPDVVLGRAGDRQPVLGHPGDRRGSRACGSAATTRSPTSR